MKRKLIPSFVMLSAGAIAGILSWKGGYDLKSILWNILISLVVFYILGSCLKMVLDYFHRQNEEKEQMEHGEVIEKEMGEDDAVQEEAEIGDDERGGEEEAVG